MIGRLTGQIVECRPDHVMLDVAGVGYYLEIPLSTFYPLCETPRSTATLHVHTHVREDALKLYGFFTHDEKATFELLIGISGIGPRVALAFLSGIGIDELHRSIQDQDRARLVPAGARGPAPTVCRSWRPTTCCFWEDDAVARTDKLINPAPFTTQQSSQQHSLVRGRALPLDLARGFFT